MNTRGSRAARSAYVLISVLLWIIVAIGIVRFAEKVIGFTQGGYRLSLPLIMDGVDVELPRGFAVAGGPPIRAVIEDPSLAPLVLATVPPALWWAGAVAILWLLRRLARSAREGDPFRVSNVGRLRKLGLLFLLGYPLATITDGFLTDWFFSAGVWPESRPFPPIVIEFQVLSGTALLAGVSLLVPAEVFAQACGYGRTSMPSFDAVAICVRFAPLSDPHIRRCT